MLFLHGAQSLNRIFCMRNIKRTWTESESGFDRVDTDAGIIYGVRILGKTSRNGRTYRESALRKAVADQLYEGARVYIDHNRPDPKTGTLAERSIRDKWGQLRNVRFEQDGLVGDLHYLKSHTMTGMLIESAQRFPETFGLSHDAGGEEQVSNGQTEVVEIQRVKSVDVVNCPATTKGLFESKETSMKKTLKEIAGNKAKFASILEDMLAADEGMGDTMVEMDAEYVEDPEMQVASAFRAAMISVLDDESLDTAGKLAKLKTILGAKEAATKAINGDESKEVPDELDGMEESVKEKFVAMQAKLLEAESKLTEKALLEECTTLLTGANREVSDVRIAALKAVKKADRKALVESWEPKKVAKAKPFESPAKFLESSRSAPSGSEYPASTSDFAGRLR